MWDRMSEVSREERRKEFLRSHEAHTWPEVWNGEKRLNEDEVLEKEA
jgi:hypothetical protein